MGLSPKTFRVYTNNTMYTNDTAVPDVQIAVAMSSGLAGPVMSGNRKGLGSGSGTHERQMIVVLIGQVQETHEPVDGLVPRKGSRR